ncbi:MAG TPA: hypothetical protein VF169_15150 [Albitalea sp.]|uniref:hypothetical protein n=1 Tax=Piscinibacter sp. TaxID=1903157 RepID=UPI002ED05327
MQRTFLERRHQQGAEADDFATAFRELSEHRGELTWSAVLESGRVLLVAEAGAGKSYECERQADLMFKQGQAAFFLRLEHLTNRGVADLLRKKERRRFQAWRANSSQPGYFFLDSIDELELSHGSFREALGRIADDLEGELGRAVIVVTSRPVPIDRQAFADILPVPRRPTTTSSGEGFVRIAMGEASRSDEEQPADIIKEFTLSPLGDVQILELAREQGVQSPQELLDAIRLRNAHDFARWPQELIELCDDWNKHGEIRAHLKQVESHVDTRLKARTDRRERADLSVEKARRGGQRLALAVMLCRRSTFRYSASADELRSGEEALDPAVLLPDWNVHEIATLLQRPLFGDSGYGRVRFRHRSVLEYLAACQIHHQIVSGSLSLSAAKRLLLGLTDTNEIVSKPSMRPVTAWLALLRPDVLATVLQVDPGTLLTHGDPQTLQPEQCERALRAFVALHGAGQRRGLEVPRLQVSRLAAHPLGAAVLDLWRTGIENSEIRLLLLRLVAEGAYGECADLAASVASDVSAANVERFEALVALSELSDERLAGLIQSATSLAPGWPQQIGRWVGTYLYPEHASDEQLLLLLSKVTRESKRELDYADSVARVIEKADLSIGRLKALLPGLVALTRRLVKVDDDEIVEPEGVLKASLILRAACARLLAQGVTSDEVLAASALAFRSAGTPYDRRNGNAGLAKHIAQLAAALRRRVFDADYNWLMELSPSLEPEEAFVRLVYRDGPLRFTHEQDWDWVIEALGARDGALKYREVLVHLAVHLAPRKDSKLGGVKAMRRAVVDAPTLLTRLQEQVSAACRPNPHLARMQEKQEKHEAQRQRKAAQEREQWRAVWRMLAKKPRAALAANRRDNTIWNIGLALRNKPRNQGEARWDRPFLEESFGAAATDALRDALMIYWRERRPTVRRERSADEKNVYQIDWTYGLVGIYAEAEDQAWIAKLSPAEAELAVRYALLELNGLPSWLATLGKDHPQAVEQVIGEEILAELAEVSGPQGWSSMLLQTLRYGRREVVALIEGRLLTWLRGAQAMMRPPYAAGAERKLEQVIGVLLINGSSESRRWIAELATYEVRAAGDGPFLAFWVTVLCRTDASRGLAVLLTQLARLPVEKNGMAVNLIGRLFDDRVNAGATNWRATLSPDERLQLVRSVHHHVDPAQDNVHDGVYSPDSRDHAEDARRYTFNELMAAEGPGALAAKLALADDPVFAHLADHIKAQARERLAAEVDASIFSPRDLATMLAGGELPPKTGTDMAHLLVNRLDDLQELMLRDTSPRAAWAFVAEENALRPAIARELEVQARGAYTVDQEAVTADGKETDIRLRSLSEHQATIELKIGEKERSGQDLWNTIEAQLVNKYMAHSKARTGCLLVTVSNPAKQWQDPRSGVLLDRFGLQEMLNEAAQIAQQRLGGEARVLARVLDLTPRLSTEIKARAARRNTAPQA